MAGKFSKISKSDSAKYIPTRNGGGNPAGRKPGQLNRVPGSNAGQKRSI